jgi:PIN domain nuclease of toxin-antitoxin system
MEQTLCNKCGQLFDGRKQSNWGAFTCSWHPRAPRSIGNTGPRGDYAELWYFPCCGKGVVGEIVNGNDVGPKSTGFCSRIRRTVRACRERRLGRPAVILLDTHNWIGWISQRGRLQPRHRELLELGAERVSVISCWDFAKLSEYGRLKLDRTVGLWIAQALAHPGISLVQLDPRIAVESTQLPPPFHRDPADQLLVATARVIGCPLLTEDRRIASSPHVRLA